MILTINQDELRELCKDRIPPGYAITHISKFSGFNGGLRIDLQKVKE